MHRIDASGHVNDRFSNGNPAAGQRATVVSADWLNDVQENIAHVIEQAEIALVKSEANQLYLAIVALAAGAAGAPNPEGDPSVPPTRLINTSGLLAGGGTLANNLNLSVPVASTAEITAGLDNTKAITPLRLRQAAGALFGVNGYIWLPGGLIMQWGGGLAGGNTNTIFTLPTTFPNANRFTAVDGGIAGTERTENNPVVSGHGLSSISVWNARDEAVNVLYFAIGH